MSELWIDRLTLQLPGLSQADGQRLALQVADGLRVLEADGSRDISTLRLDLAAKPNATVDELARQIIAEVVRQVRRLP